MVALRTIFISMNPLVECASHVASEAFLDNPGTILWETSDLDLVRGTRDLVALSRHFSFLLSLPQASML